MIALGTVQFGLPYGVANQSGQVARVEAAAILEHAWAAGLDTLDTAMAYGESEQRLGEIGVGRWAVVSKLPPLPELCRDVAGWVNEAVAGSLTRLGISRLRGLLLHRSQELMGKQGAALRDALDGLKRQGVVEKIGISIYSPDELTVLWPCFRPELVQAPFNVLDRRLATTGWLTRLREANTEIHTRSAFLQGLLLMAPDRRPPFFDRWRPVFDEWHRWCSDQGLTALQACLGFVHSQPGIDRIVVGVDSVQQLREILAGCGAGDRRPPAALMSEDQDLINPSRWTFQ